MKQGLLGGLAILCLLPWMTRSLCGQSVAKALRTVVLAGDPVPGSTSGATFLGIRDARIDAQGNGSFVASVGYSRHLGLWTEYSGSLHTIIDQGAPVPGDPDGSVSWLVDPEDSDDRVYDFLASPQGIIAQATTTAGKDSARIWRFPTPDRAELVVSAGQTFPSESREFHQFQLLAGNARSAFVFRATLRLPSETDVSQDSIWISSPEKGPELLARSGVLAVGTDGLIFDDMFHGGAAINDHGLVSFIAEVREQSGLGVIHSSSLLGVWQGTSLEDLKLIAVGEATDPTKRISSGFIDNLDMNNNGDVAFKETGAIWRHNSGGLGEVVTNRDTLTIGEMHGVFTRFGVVDIADDGSVAFESLYLPEESGELLSSFSTFWEEQRGELVPIAYPGFQLSDGIRMIGSTEPWFDRNAAGQVVTEKIIEIQVESDTTTVNAILAQDLNNEWHTIVHDGQLVEVSPGDFRTVQFVRPAGSEEVGLGWINDRGQVGVRLRFQDGSSGFFVSNAVAIPEPGGFLTILLGVPLLWRRR